MDKFNNTTKTNVSVSQSVILHSIAVEISNELLQPIREQFNMTEEEYI